MRSKQRRREYNIIFIFYTKTMTNYSACACSFMYLFFVPCKYNVLYENHLMHFSTVHFVIISYCMLNDLKVFQVKSCNFCKSFESNLFHFILFFFCVQDFDEKLQQKRKFQGNQKFLWNDTSCLWKKERKKVNDSLFKCVNNQVSKLDCFSPISKSEINERKSVNIDNCKWEKERRGFKWTGSIYYSTKVLKYNRLLYLYTEWRRLKNYTHETYVHEYKYCSYMYVRMYPNLNSR